MSFIWFVIIGALAGWIGGRLMRGEGFGLLGNIVVGIVGAVLGGWLFDKLNIYTGGLAGGLAAAVVGAILFLFIVGLLNRNK